jgi:hypothetical protein
VRELAHRAAQVGVVEDDLHCPAAEDVRRAHEHRIAHASGDGHRLVDGRRGAAFRLRDAEAVAQLVEALAVLGRVDRRRARAEDRDAVAFEEARELQRRLPAEAHDHTRE